MSDLGEHEPGPSRTWDKLVFSGKGASAAKQVGRKRRLMAETGPGGPASG